MIKRLFLRFGPFGEQTPLVLEPSAMTVFVGPNNSGKSLILRELQHYAEQGRSQARCIVEGIEISIPGEDEAKSLLKGRKARIPVSETLPEGHIRAARPIPSSGSASHINVNLDQLLQYLAGYRTQQEEGSEDWWKTCWAGVYSQYTALFTVALDGKTRLALTEQRTAGDLQAAPANHLAALFQHDDARKRVRRIAYEAFRRYFVIDPTHLSHLRIRMSTRPPDDDQEEQALDDRARKFHGAATDIAELSDGVKAFTGLVSALISSDYRIMLVDEPEAFLHPPLAGQLGREMATLADTRSGNVFASTHSARFLMGCLESGKPTNIVRLTYSEPYATARVLPADRIQELMRDPLLRSAGVLEAFFYSGAVVCEADRDRVFYNEINNRLQAGSRSYIQDSVFLNAQNKQTVRRIVGPLREMGIPAAAIVDFDIVKGNDLKDLLNDCFVPPDLVQSLGQLRGNVEAHFRDKIQDMKSGGISLLVGGQKESCQSLLDQLSSYGIFIVPNGEVESWLRYLGINASKIQWLPEVFARMGSNPERSDYVTPIAGDVWAFLENASKWIRNSDRIGMPGPQ
jgi:ABC-type polar amino acid transport system ATPase subunit